MTAELSEDFDLLHCRLVLVHPPRNYTAWEDATRHPEWRTFLWFLASLWGRKPIEEVV